MRFLLIIGGKSNEYYYIYYADGWSGANYGGLGFLHCTFVCSGGAEVAWTGKAMLVAPEAAALGDGGGCGGAHRGGHG